MCGISGILSFKNQIDVGRVTRMTDSIEHRGPDGSGLWSNNLGNICLGHRRLAIIDLTERGAQPMLLNNRFTITFNGEIYNFLQLKIQLIQQGYKFHSNTDTEVLLTLYSIHGIKCLDLIDGMFAFAIWDNFEQTLFCARDRFGEKPFYYSKSEDEFVFGSEIKSLFAAGTPKQVNKKRLFTYIVNNEIEDTIDKSSTFYESIFSLEASHYLIVKQNEFIKKAYYDIDTNSINNNSIGENVEQFKYLINKSVKDRLEASDVNVGTSLSGGVDSSIIYFELQKLINDPFTFTASFPGFIKDEAGLVNETFSRYPTKNGHFIFPTALDYIENLDLFFHHQDEPVRNANLFAQWCVYQRAAATETKVLLDGQGADEVFAGYHLYFQPYLQQLLRKNPLVFLFEMKKYTHSNYVNYDRHFYVRTIFPKVYKKLAMKRNYHLGNMNDINLNLVDEFVNEMDFQNMNNSNLRQIQKYNIFYSGLEQLLRYGDRSSMAHSVEVRLPFLSREIVDFAFSLPDNQKIKNGYTKYIERLSFSENLPRNIIWKKDKIGYEAPQNAWSENKLIKDKIMESIMLLQKNQILNMQVDMSKWWQYIQCAKLIES